MDKLFGYMGIDTKYERELLNYKPIISFLKKKSSFAGREEVSQLVERSEMFPTYQIIHDYQELIGDLNDLIKYIEVVTGKELIQQSSGFLSEKKLTDLFQFEKSQDAISNHQLLDVYSICLFLLDSMQFRLDDILSKYVTQFSKETDVSKIEADEKQSVLEWKTLESKTAEAYTSLVNEDQEHDHIVDGFIHTTISHEMIEELERLTYEKELLHTTLSDLAYIHRNRFFMMMETIEKLKTLVYDPTSLVADGLDSLVHSIFQAKDKTAMESHLLIAYKKEKDKHHSMKFKYLEFQSPKERFAADKQYFLQQLELKAKQSLTTYLYDNMDASSTASDKFNSLLVKSLEQTSADYELILAEMLNFYRTEALFYEQILLFLKNKQEIRVFYRICKDLQEKESIDIQWVGDYISRLLRRD